MNTRRFLCAICLMGFLLAASVRADDKPAPDPAAPLKVHIISGSGEYKSEPSLKEYKDFLEKNYRVTCTASWGKDSGPSLDNLDALPDAELMVVFARRMKLPEEQMKLIRQHWQKGKAIIGIRTAGHAFQQADNEVFDKQVLGGHYKGHYGNEPVKVANVESQARHPVLAGVAPFGSSKLYSAGELAKDTVVLQTGDIDKAKHPVTMVHTFNGGRTFFTSLGIPEDFQDKNFRQMLLNAVFWTTQRDPAKMKK